QFETADAAERIGDDERLDVELARIRNVRVHAPSAKRIAGHLATIDGSHLHGRRGGVSDASADPLDAPGYSLARDGAADQNDLAVDARDHAAASRGFLDRERQELAGCDHLSS